MTEQRRPDAFLVEHATRYERSSDRSLTGGSEQQADRGHLAEHVQPHRDRIDVKDRQPFARRVELLRREPAAFRLGGDLGHVSFLCLLYTSPSPRDGLLSRM